jgi:hypothetical protein
MRAEVPSFDATLSSVKQLAESPLIQQSQQHSATLGEVRRRLERLSIEAKRLIELNNILDDTTGIAINFDPGTDALIFKHDDVEMKIQLRRENPEIPLQISHLTSGEAYDATREAHQSPDRTHLHQELESTIEIFYYSAHRVLKLLQTIPGLKKLSCREITIVRNKLVEHAPLGSFYSFGCGSTGPRIKPIYKNPIEWNDEGLVPNTRSFLKSIETGIKRLLSLDIYQ